MGASSDFSRSLYQHTASREEIETCIPFEAFATVEMGAFSDFSVSTYRHTPSPEEIEKSIKFERFTTHEIEKYRKGSLQREPFL